MTGRHKWPPPMKSAKSTPWADEWLREDELPLLGRDAALDAVLLRLARERRAHDRHRRLHPTDYSKGQLTPAEMEQTQEYLNRPDIKARLQHDEEQMAFCKSKGGHAWEVFTQKERPSVVYAPFPYMRCKWCKCSTAYEGREALEGLSRGPVSSTYTPDAPGVEEDTDADS